MFFDIGVWYISEYRSIISHYKILIYNILKMKKVKNILKGISALGTAALAFPASVMAQANWSPTVGPAAKSVDELIRIILNTAIIAAAVVAVVFLIINGFQYMTAGGDSGKTEQAQKGLANALIGLVIIIAAALIVNFLLGKLGMTPQSL